MLGHLTKRGLELAEGPISGASVRLRPELVVEVAFDGVQKSTRYSGGIVLRFARVRRFREDKTPAEADSINTIRQLFVDDT